MLSGETCTLPSRWNSKQVMPPNAAMYWSCFPAGLPSSTISTCEASSARSPAVTCSRFHAYTAFSRPTVNAPDEPSPVPAGMSARLTTSSDGPIACSVSTARMIGCSICVGSVTRSSAEYLRK